MNSKLVFMAVAIVAVFSIAVTTPALAQDNMTMMDKNMTGGMMKDNMTMMDKNMTGGMMEGNMTAGG